MNMLWTRQVVFSYWDFRRENSYACSCCLQPHVSNLYVYTLSKQNSNQGLEFCKAEAI